MINEIFRIFIDFRIKDAFFFIFSDFDIIITLNIEEKFIVAFIFKEIFIHAHFIRDFIFFEEWVSVIDEIVHEIFFDSNDVDDHVSEIVADR